MILLCENKAGLKLKAAKFSPKTVHIGLPQDFFDFIIIDECHRGGANDESEWRKLMEYFQPSYQLGLTATPRRTINGDTYKYFGEPVYQYSLKQGIEDGYLTPYRVKAVLIRLLMIMFTMMNGIIQIQFVLYVKTYLVPVQKKL